MASEIQPDKNTFYRLFRQYSRESVLIILVCITLVASVISWFRAERAIDAANEALAQATTWQQMYKETERECRLAQNDVQALQMDLVEAGIPQTHGKKQ